MIIIKTGWYLYIEDEVIIKNRLKFQVILTVYNLA